ncbi:hypothetical protein [Cohnella fermenti]|uniref:Polymer-forming cytoskeletal protein n=1 Tax=Cohnella fermenti TaxID=2565925 RepID=A0A4S4C4F7_9BACL|nr:hypothetical protein [Cohnella fermenti]THF82666.1 hypothetical protein E6C55_06250 [Cohnella fermenti]
MTMAIPANNGNMRLVGETTMNGGTFGRITIIGESKLNGATECESFSCTGNSEVDGDLTAGKLKVIGELEIAGDLKARSVSVTGETRVKGGAQGDLLNVRGGEFAVGADCEFEEIKVYGAIRAGGLLSADRMELRLFGGSLASEIGGGHILIKMSKKLAIKKLFSLHDFGTIKVGTIEGDTIELEHTAADVVRGNRVTIGPGCEIGRVEYRGELKVSAKAKVGSQARVE